MAEQARVFISHHHSPHEDAFTERLQADLETAGADVWVDTAGATYDDFVKRINDGLAESDWLLLVMTPAALQSQWVQSEVNAAIRMVRQGLMRGVIPLVAEACQERDIPPLWATLQRYEATRDYTEALSGALCVMGLDHTTVVVPLYTAPPASSLPSTMPDQSGGVSHRPTTFAGTTRIVDAGGRGEYRALSDALQVAEPGDRIVVRAGVYPGGFTIAQPLEIVGDGSPDDIVIESKFGLLSSGLSALTGGFRALPPVIRVQSKEVRLVNISVHAIGGTDLTPDAVVVEHEGVVIVSDCAITTRGSGYGVCVKSGKATIHQTTIHDCGLSGVCVGNRLGRMGLGDGNRAEAQIEDCRIIRCGVGIEVVKGAKITLRRSRVINNAGLGIELEKNAAGTLENNDLRGNRKGSVKFDQASAVSIKLSGNLE